MVECLYRLLRYGAGRPMQSSTFDDDDGAPGNSNGYGVVFGSASGVGRSIYGDLQPNDGSAGELPELVRQVGWAGGLKPPFLLQLYLGGMVQYVGNASSLQRTANVWRSSWWYKLNLICCPQRGGVGD